MMTCSTSSGLTPARSRAARIAIEPSAGAGSAESFPRNEPIGVRAAERITRFFIRGGFYAATANYAAPYLADSSFQPERTVVALQYVFRQFTSFRHCSTLAHAVAAFDPGESGVVCVHGPEKAGF